MTNPIGLYVHIPFCLRKCNYCDFCSFPLSEIDFREKYISALCDEILSYKGRNISVDSIFFGGGTPSLLSCDEFSEIVSKIREAFLVSSDVEFTLEANPKTLTEEKLSHFCKMGVNRLSIGLQSIHENEEKILGRVHNYEDFLHSYSLARKCGVQNVNFDLMYGIPEQTEESFLQTLDTVISLSPDHLSVYGLILEEGTRFFEEQDQLVFPDEETECNMYYTAAEKLRRYGYSHYEISNYSKPGKECRHNLKYWRDEEYIGVGISAYSYFGGERFGNCRVTKEYLSEEKEKYSYKENIGIKEEAYEYVMLRLRLSEGFSLSDYKDRFGIDFMIGREEKLERMERNDLISVKNGKIALTERGFYLSNSILTELL